MSLKVKGKIGTQDRRVSLSHQLLRLCDCNFYKAQCGSGYCLRQEWQVDGGNDGNLGVAAGGLPVGKQDDWPAVPRDLHGP